MKLAMPLFALATGILIGFAHPSDAAIGDRITTFQVTLPQPLEARQNNFCTWGFCDLSPRLYSSPLPDGKILVGWSDASGNGHVSRVNGSSLEATFNFPSLPVRGLVAHADGSFAVLLWDKATPGTYWDNIMKLSKRNASGGAIWTTTLVNADAAVPNPVNSSGIGDGRLGYGGGKYGAYFSVHSQPDGGGLEHEGDQLTFVDDNGVIQAGGWAWGLSHSMAELIDYHPELNRLTAVGVSDCFPGKGLHATHSSPSEWHSLFASDGNCGGSVSAQLGQIAAADGSRWIVAFSALAHGGFPGQGIGILSFAGNYVPSAVTWLTNTNGTEERDPVLGRIGAPLNSNRYLVGWRMQTSGEFKLGIINSAGTFLEAAETVSPGITWGNRDDSFRTQADGDVCWVQGSANSTTLRIHCYSDQAGPACGITDLAAGAQTACNPATNTYTQQVVVTYHDPPTSGTLDVNGQSFAIGTSPQSVTLQGLPSNGAPVNVTAAFSAQPTCARTENALFTAPAACIPVASVCVSPALPIPDNTPSGVTSGLVMNQNMPIQQVRVFVDITHTWIGDLIVRVTHGATTVTLHNLSGNDQDDIVGWYPTDFPVDGPGSLSDFNGASSNGTWTLFVSDNASQDIGVLNEWCVEVTGPAVAVEEGSSAPAMFAVLPSYPNPVRTGAATIRFTLPERRVVTLRVYDGSGRLVRELFDGQRTAGMHKVEWDGADQHGRQVASGVYFYQLDAGQESLTRKLTLVR